jgi:predicted carbohydrate-binding protein with CBM5 and CBM33 domain
LLVTAARKIAAVGIVPLVLVALAGPADAHGAMTNPISRAAACGPEGGQAARSKACQAARAVSDAAALRDWDNLRVSGVGGDDRQKIPDGKLCSGGLAAYRGLDLPRRDWPTTKLTSGVRFTFGYRTTIPHRGTFKLYVTKSGYDPTRRLKWSDLETRPFAAVTDPPVRDGSYVIKGRLPRGRSGHHVIFTIWQNSSTPDTYYSCSDVVFSGGRSHGGGAAATAKKKDKGKSEATTSAPVPQATESTGVGDREVSAVNRSSSGPLPMVAGGGAMAVVLAGGACLLLIRRGRRRAPAGRPHHRHDPPSQYPPNQYPPGRHPTSRGFGDEGEETW